MSALKAAQTIKTTFTVTGKVLKWLAIVVAVVGVGVGLWAWANAHVLSFAIVMGIIGALFLFGVIMSLWEWSNETIDEAIEEERRAQERNRVEKDRLENPDKYVSSFDDDDDYDPTDPYGLYR